MAEDEKLEETSEDSQNQTVTNQDEVDSKLDGSTERKVMNMFNTYILNKVNGASNVKHSRKESVDLDSHSPKSVTSKHDIPDNISKIERNNSYVSSSHNKSMKFGNETTPKRLKLVTELVDEEIESPDNKRNRAKPNVG